MLRWRRPAQRSGRTRRMGQHPRHAQPRQNLPGQHVVYRQRNAAERFFNKLKHFRAVVTRCDKRDVRAGRSTGITGAGFDGEFFGTW